MTAERHNVRGYDDHGAMVTVARLLEARGYTRSDLAKLMGENFLRVFRAVFPKA